MSPWDLGPGGDLGYGVGGMKKLGQRRGRGGWDAFFASSTRHSTIYIATALLKTGVVAMRRRCRLVLVTARDGMQKGCLVLRTTHRISGKGHICTIDLLGRDRAPAAADMGWHFGPRLDAAGIWHINGGVEKAIHQHPRVPNVRSAVRWRSRAK